MHALQMTAFTRYDDIHSFTKENKRTAVHSSMVLQFQGVAHPPPGSGRAHSADLNRAEISNTIMHGTPLLVEHEAGTQCGRVLTSWEGPKGELRVLANVSNPRIEREIHNGTLRGLSLGTDMIKDTEGNILYRGQQELSVCEEGMRHGTWIHEIDGKKVYDRADFSKKRKARASPITPSWRVTEE